MPVQQDVDVRVQLQHPGAELGAKRVFVEDRKELACLLLVRVDLGIRILIYRIKTSIPSSTCNRDSCNFQV